MSNGYDNELRGVLFKNKDKRPDKKDPDYRGHATIGGVEFWLDSWINEPKSGGDKFMAVKFKPKDVQPAPVAEQPYDWQKARESSKPAAVAAPAGAEPFNDDIPF
jgi:hypothetical protein